MAPESTSGGPALLLIVDDEPLNRELLRRVLQRHYDIEEAEDAAGALEVLERRGDEVQLVLCDQLMPGKSGTELATEVRQRWPGLVFMLLTGYDDDPAVTRAHAEGLVSRVISKPWRGSALKRVIEEALSG
jgi:two-component system, NtrC family, response regulator HupR/HoxA